MPLANPDFQELLAVLDLNRVYDNTFTGSHPSKNPPRTFGGQMMAQAFVAASRTLTRELPAGRDFDALHRRRRPGEGSRVPRRAAARRRRFANRRVDVMQDGELLTTALVSFVDGGRGLEHGIVRRGPRPVVVAQDRRALVGYEETVPHFVEALRPIEWRYTNDPAWVCANKGERLDHNRVWLKAEGPMPDDLVLHPAALVYPRTPRCSTRSSPRTAVVGLRPHLRGDGQSLGVVPPAGPV